MGSGSSKNKKVAAVEGTRATTTVDDDRVVVVKERKQADLTSFQDHYREALASGDVPIDMLLAQASSLKAAMGPLMVSLDEKKRGRTSLVHEKNEGLVISTNVDQHDFRLKTVNAELVVLKSEVEAATLRLEDIQMKTAAMVGESISDATFRYAEAINSASPDGADRQEFTSTAQMIINVGPLEVGQIVHVQDCGSMLKCKVLQAKSDHTYELVLWKVFETNAGPWEHGFDTPYRETREYKRSLIYASVKQQQTVSTCSTQGVPSTDIRFLLGMYAAAERSNAMLQDLGQSVATDVNRALGASACTPMNAPLKATGRVMEKVAEKYSGDFSKVCDLARMTFACQSFKAATLTLKCIAAYKKLKVGLMKDRMMAEFDAQETGGYRDALLNVEDVESGHIAEVQITLQQLLKIKTGGGHSRYKLVRLLDLNDARTFKFNGALSPRVIDKIRCGLIREVVSPSGLAEHFDMLVSALSARTCMLHHIDLSGNEFPPHKDLSHLFTTAVVTQLAPRLYHVSAYGTQLGGSIPESFFDLTKLKYIALNRTQLTGPLSPSIGKLLDLENMWIWETEMTGEPPVELNRLKKLQRVQLHPPYTFAIGVEQSKWKIYKGPHGGEVFPDFKAAWEAWKDSESQYEESGSDEESEEEDVDDEDDEGEEDAVGEEDGEGV